MIIFPELVNIGPLRNMGGGATPDMEGGSNDSFFLVIFSKFQPYRVGGVCLACPQGFKKISVFLDPID
jgi:hypothetical protein